MIRAGINYISDFFSSWLDFDSHTTRKDYWLTQLSLIILWTIVLTVVGVLEGITLTYGLTLGVSGFIALVSLIPSLALTIRRLRDTGFSTWLVLLPLLPLGAFVLFVFTVLPTNFRYRQGY
jgi:uncharacterized membrane protein YhaH (DUF805 family)